MEHIGYTNAQPDLDVIFSALADPTRREILSRLAEGQATVKDLSKPFKMSQPAVSKHLKVLERAGLIERDIDKQRRPAILNAENMALAVDWLSDFKAYWGARFTELDNVLLSMKQNQIKD